MLAILNKGNSLIVFSLHIWCTVGKPNCLQYPIGQILLGKPISRVNPWDGGLVEKFTAETVLEDSKCATPTCTRL